MSASPFTSLARKVTAPVPRRNDVRRRATTLLVGALLLTSAAACTADPNGVDVTPVATSSMSPTASASPPDEQAALLEQYRRFWATLTPVSRLPATERRAVLTELAVDPALKSLLSGMEQADAKGQIFYGADVPRPTVRINPDASTALVDDCQDSSAAGVANKQTGERITVGVARNHVSVTMKKQPGEPWKVAFVDYAKSPC